MQSPFAGDAPHLTGKPLIPVMHHPVVASSRRNSALVPMCTPTLLLVTIITATITTTCKATKQAETQQSEPARTPLPLPTEFKDEWRRGRLFYMSSEAPMATRLQTNKTFIQSSQVLDSYLNFAENSTLRVLQSNQEIPKEQTIRVCNTIGRRTIEIIEIFFEDRGLPLPNATCFTTLHGTTTFTNETSPWTASDINTALLQRQVSLHHARKQIVQEVLPPKNWTQPDTNFNYRYNISSKQCVMNHAVGFRVGSKWFLGTSITNPGRTHNARLFERQWLTEYIHTAPDDTNTALKFSARVRPPGDEPHVVRTNTTTTLTSGRGAVGPFAFRHAYPSQNEVLAASLEKSDLSIQQADDALTPSSLSILLLPLGLNLIPVALLAPVDTVTMLMYMVMSDVITTIPLAIKGVELIFIGRERHVSTAVQFTASVSGELSQTASMQIWSAECMARENVTRVGIAFVVLAAIFIAMGISLELIAKSYVDRHRRLRKRGADTWRKRQVLGASGEVLKGGRQDGASKRHAGSVGTYGSVDDDGHGSAVSRSKTVSVGALGAAEVQSDDGQAGEVDITDEEYSNVQYVVTQA